MSREKKLLVASDDYGRDLTGVQNLLKKHKRLEAELASHEPAIQAVQEAGEKLMDVSNLGVPEIEQRLKALGERDKIRKHHMCSQIYIFFNLKKSLITITCVTVIFNT